MPGSGIGPTQVDEPRPTGTEVLQSGEDQGRTPSGESSLDSHPSSSTTEVRDPGVSKGRDEYRVGTKPELKEILPSRLTGRSV